jgi:hypothetical protein
MKRFVQACAWRYEDFLDAGSVLGYGNSYRLNPAFANGLAD